MSLPCIFGRETELEQLRMLMSRRNSFLLHGPAGVGKTLLVKQVIAEVDDVLYCDESSSSQLVFRKLLAQLKARNAYARQACGTHGVEAVSAVSARGIVAEALGEHDYWIVLDHLQSPSQSFATSVKDVCSWTNTPLLAVARSAHMEDAGFFMPMFPGRSEKFELRSFDPATAKQFAMCAVQEMNLHATNLQDVLDKVVHFSKGNPGAIRTMLQMAANPKYVVRQHVKLSPLYIDFRLQWGADRG
jgi:AAA ATPase domain